MQEVFVDLWCMKFSHQQNADRKKAKKQKDTLIQSVLSLHFDNALHPDTFVKHCTYKLIWIYKRRCVSHLKISIVQDQAGVFQRRLDKRFFPSGYRTSIEVQFTRSGKVEVYVRTYYLKQWRRLEWLNSLKL